MLRLQSSAPASRSLRLEVLMMRSPLPVLAALLLTPLPAFAQQEPTPRLEWIFGDSSFLPFALPSYAWLRDGTLALYDATSPPGARTIERLDPATGRRTPLVDAQRALASLRQHVDSTAVPALTWPAGFDSTGSLALYSINGDLYVLDTRTATFRRLTRTQESEDLPRLSPDGSRVAFARGRDLYVIEVASGMERRLTNDGSETVLNGKLAWVYWEELFGRQDGAFWWSPDSRSIAFYRTDENPVGVMRFSDYRTPYETVKEQRYPKAGTPNPDVRVVVVSVADGGSVVLEPQGEYIQRVNWLPDSRRVAVQTLNRGQDTLRLFLADAGTGRGMLMLTDTDPAWVNTHEDLRFLNDEQHFLWLSERTGYAHLYRYRLDGTLVNAVTSGDWALQSGSPVAFWVRKSVGAVDERNGWVYFTSGETSSIQRQVYRARLDGTRRERVTMQDGTHFTTFSPDARYFVDRFAANDSVPRLRLHRNDGSVVATLGASRPELIPFALRFPQLTTIPARDGFAMPAAITRPRDFDPARRYPVILEVYGGPSAPSVANAAGFTNFWPQLLADRGYIVIAFDNRSATGISKRLENTIDGDMYGEGELADLIDAARWVKQQPWADPARVGMWGWSGGGSYTLLGMTGSTEFRAGIAVAGVTDWRYYDTKWGEAAMGPLPANDAKYEANALTNKAANLSGRLLIVHGSGDDNVHLQNAWAFIDRLIEHGKLFDLMVYPMRGHGIADRPARLHLYRTMLEFWDRHLKGSAPAM